MNHLVQQASPSPFIQERNLRTEQQPLCINEPSPNGQSTRRGRGRPIGSTNKIPKAPKDKKGKGKLHSCDNVQGLSKQKKRKIAPAESSSTTIHYIQTPPAPPPIFTPSISHNQSSSNLNNSDLISQMYANPVLTNLLLQQGALNPRILTQLNTHNADPINHNNEWNHSSPNSTLQGPYYNSTNDALLYESDANLQSNILNLNESPILPNHEVQNIYTTQSPSGTVEFNSRFALDSQANVLASRDNVSNILQAPPVSEYHNQVSIFSDAWLPSSNTHKIPISELNFSNSHIKFVNQLIIPNTAIWNSSLLHTSFTELIVKHILNTTIRGNQTSDIIRWMGSKNGIFSVKSMYRTITTSCLTPPINPNLNLKIWKCNALPKAILFVWKCLHNCVPTRDKIGRFITIPSHNCPLCNAPSETLRHMLLECPYTWAVWFNTKLRCNMSVFQNCSTEQWIQKWFNTPPLGITNSELWTVYCVMTTWVIWKSRCSSAFQNIYLNPARIAYSIDFCVFRICASLSSLQTTVPITLHHFGSHHVRMYARSMWMSPSETKLHL
ncbi:hypothetical protein FRX31_034877 [Thalictrum thalictroides]|uniref:Reverse transcriptase zinc-binding domain-containing protein n=1 Tax=Thalictrum thalictroides TaxID=46969 RepID=A0A7J6USM0_THATH|nr:hypothetical protein FRX31_034877 [Thalictrum thalictroides]